MMINKTTEYVSYRRSMQSGIERSPRFLRRVSPSGKGADIVYISEAARNRMMEKNSTPLVKSIMSFSRELGEMVRVKEAEADAGRSAMIDELKAQIGNDSYDFERADRMESAAGALTARTERDHNGPACA